MGQPTNAAASTATNAERGLQSNKKGSAGKLHGPFAFLPFWLSALRYLAVPSQSVAPNPALEAPDHHLVPVSDAANGRIPPLSVLVTCTAVTVVTIAPILQHQRAWSPASR
ncbi:hypothetical protein AK830_g9501 [Neonectria ditissima]|uniref:Uncharacterized protein n=1 Tax=Neonectria ditissima TaxID=78410 RepID=A0A0P7BCA2_9HYPO|nr:hypothetical protein AK830_g9501 [Neonectria ditissima]